MNLLTSITLQILLLRNSVHAVYIYVASFSGNITVLSLTYVRFFISLTPNASFHRREILKACETQTWELEGKALRECSQKIFRTILTEKKISGCWMQEEESLTDWETNSNKLRNY